MLPKLIAFAISSGLAKKAWDHFQETRRARRAVTDVRARPVAAADDAPAKPHRKSAARRRKAAPSAG
jgi:hypothetical protein